MDLQQEQQAVVARHHALNEQRDQLNRQIGFNLGLYAGIVGAARHRNAVAQLGHHATVEVSPQYLRSVVCNLYENTARTL